VIGFGSAAGADCEAQSAGGRQAKRRAAAVSPGR
jgi:hypothetical protein